MNIIPMNELQTMAAAIAKSGLFGAKTPEQALTLMLVSQAEGRHPALAARDYDIIQNRPAKKAEAMLRDFLEGGGKVEWHHLDDTVADATFSHPSGGSVRIDWTIKRAIAAGLGGRDMWKKYPRQMLRSRTVSEGIRTVCPMATSGMYVPEEVHDIVKEKDITPTAGAADRLTLQQQEKVKATVDKMTEWLNSGSVGDALAEMDNGDLDADETVYAWTFFDSKQRRLMKNEQEAQRAASRAIESKVISDAQRKRLEARIGELKLDRDAVKQWMSGRFSKEHFADLNQDEYNALDAHIETLGAPKAAPQQHSPVASATDAASGAASYITADEATELETWATSLGAVRKFKTKFAVKRFGLLTTAQFDEAKAWLKAAQEYLKENA